MEDNGLVVFYIRRSPLVSFVALTFLCVGESEQSFTASRLSLRMAVLSAARSSPLSL